jgi:hypothetical protein
MATARQLASNRTNARRSTGPKTARGKAASAANALRAGLFARAAVIPALGETPADFEHFRRQVADDLGAVGPVEQELAGQVAALLWRKRRVLRYESSTATPPGVVLPPHPDEVGPAPNLTFRPPPPGTPAATRLGYVRDSLRSLRDSLAATRAAAAALAPPDSAGAPAGGPAHPGAGAAVVRVLWTRLGWGVEDADRRWADSIRQAGAVTPAGCNPVLTGPQLRRTVGLAAAGAGREETAFVAEVRAALLAETGDLTGRAGEAEKEEARLAAGLLADRVRAGLGAVYGDDAAVGRVARAEAHLTRELERCLGLLSRLQADRRAREVAAVPGLLGVAGTEGIGPHRVGFVL